MFVHVLTLVWESNTRIRKGFKSRLIIVLSLQILCEMIEIARYLSATKN